MEHKVGDTITVFTPGGRFDVAQLDVGVVKNASATTGRVYWYHKDPGKCGDCGPHMGQGAHRLGMSGSRVV